MKKLIIILILTLILSLNVYSQNDSSNKLSDSMDLKQHSIYLEVLGNSLSIYSLNYEYVIKNKFLINSEKCLSNLNIRMGAGIGAFVIPPGLIAMLNWNYGKYHNLEIGSGFRYSFGSPKEIWKSTKYYKTRTNLMITFTLGYKYIDLKDGWLFKIGLTPVISLEGIIAPAYGISYGWIW